MASEQERKVTTEEIAQWYTPRQALLYASGNQAGHYMSARDAVWVRVTGGLIECAASFRIIDEPGKPTAKRTEPQIIPLEMWMRYSEPNSDFWGMGDATFVFRNRSSHDPPSTIKYLGIRLNPANVHSTIPRPQGGAQEAPIEPRPGASIQKTPSQSEEKLPRSNLAETKVIMGAPPKDWWDDFWIAICHKIYEGDLKPKRQADLERAMLDWASENGHKVSEATIRKAAKKLFLAWKLGG